MNTQLSSDQKKKLEAFSGFKGEVLDSLFKSIEYHLKNSYLHTDDSKTVKALEVARLCDEISKTSLKLKNQLRRLPEFDKISIESALGREFSTPSPHKTIKVYNEPILTTDKIDVIRALEVISCSALGTSGYNRKLYSNGYLNVFIIGMEMVWGTFFGNRPEKITLEGEYVAFFSIVLDKLDKEAVFKQLLRSKNLNAPSKL
jgi:hypothetical protein